jgi:hypothetical protein
MKDNPYSKITALLRQQWQGPSTLSPADSAELSDMSMKASGHLPMSHTQHDVFLKARRERVRFSIENRRAIVSEKHLNETTAFIRQIAQIDITLSQVETMLDLYPFVRIQVAKYGVYTDRTCMDEIANMVGDFFLGRPWEGSHSRDAGKDREFIMLLRRQAEKMGYRLMDDPLKESK